MARNVTVSSITNKRHYNESNLSFIEMKGYIEKRLSATIDEVLPDKPDLLVFPENCDIPSGYEFGKFEEYIKLRADDNIRFFSRVAKENNCNVAFTSIRQGGGDHYLNTTFVLDRRGRLAGFYNKNHLQPDEFLLYKTKCGTEAPVIELDIGRVACVICFDLNFDELRLKYKAAKPDLIIFSSMFHGGLLQKIWAQTCRSYFVGSVGTFNTCSILSPQGETIAYSTYGQRYATAAINLDYALVHWDYNSDKLNNLKKKYGRGVTVFDPDFIDSVLVTSNIQGVSAMEMLKEFEIELYDDFLTRSVRLQQEPANRAFPEDEIRTHLPKQV